jgi:uncharacterized protein
MGFIIMRKTNVLITGGSGLVGTRLTEILLDKGYNVSHLSRKEDLNNPIKKYKWDIETNFIDKKAFENIDHIIHLAGAGVAEKRWTEERKKEILNSRIDSTKLLHDILKSTTNTTKSVVSASAIGYYGFGGDNKAFVETDKPANDFLANVTKLWEAEVDKITNLNIRIVKLRIGVVLTDKGGALPQMALPIKLLAGSPLGSGKQVISWIDLDDLCNMFVYALENTQMVGAYNAVAPNPATNKIFTEAIGKALNRPIWPLSVPNFVLKLVLGEMAVMATGDCNVQNKRIKNETNFKYQYPDLEKCLKRYL